MNLALKNVGKKLDLRRLKIKRCIFLSFFITELSPLGGSSLVRTYLVPVYMDGGCPG